MDSVLVARDDRVDRRVIPRAETVEAEFVLVICERRGHFDGEELRRDLPDHWALNIPRPLPSCVASTMRISAEDAWL